MKLRSKMLALCVLGMCAAGQAGAQSAPRSYAVMSLIGDTIELRAKLPGIKINDAESDSVVPLAERVFDVSALTRANTVIQQVQPGARIVALMTDDDGLYKAQNAMFDAPDANRENREYLLSLLKDRGVSHLILVTKLKSAVAVRLRDGSAGTCSVEGLGFLIDDTTWLRNTKTGFQHGLLAPFAYMKLRLLDAATLEVVAESHAIPSMIIENQLHSPDAKDVWLSLTTAKKTAYLDDVLNCGIKAAIPALLNAKTAAVVDASCACCGRER